MGADDYAVLYQEITDRIFMDNGETFARQLRLSGREVDNEYFNTVTVSSVTLPAGYTFVTITVATWAPSPAPTIDSSYPTWLVGILATVGAAMCCIPVFFVIYNRTCGADPEEDEKVSVEMTRETPASVGDVEVGL